MKFPVHLRMIFLFTLLSTLSVKSQDTITVYLLGDLEDGVYVGLTYQHKAIGVYTNSKCGFEYALRVPINTDSIAEFQMLDLELSYTKRKSKRLKPLPIIFYYDPQRTNILILTKPEKKKEPWFQTMYLPDIKEAPFYID